jgi:predicted dehydrogenase
MKKYNVGIVGYGWVATAHIPAINATALGQVTAVCSSRKLEAAALSAQHGGRICVYSDPGTNKASWSALAMKLVDSGDVSDHPYQAQFAAFFDALDAGKEMPLTSLDDAVISHEAVFAADRSAELGRPVKLSELK